MRVSGSPGSFGKPGRGHRDHGIRAHILPLCGKFLDPPYILRSFSVPALDGDQDVSRSYATAQGDIYLSPLTCVAATNPLGRLYLYVRPKDPLEAFDEQFRQSSRLRPPRIPHSPPLN
jgi:hypothetical protein